VSSETGSYQRHVDGLVALLLSLKKKPIIRYERMSSMAKKLGQEVQVSQLTEVGGCPDAKHCSLGSI
jgi:predicted site-specific integrase-resolvase